PDFQTGDPVCSLLLNGEASTVEQAEELFLDRHLQVIVDLAESGLSEREFRDHWLIRLLLSHGSRGWEDSLE
ncbi:MAG: hypothetical protein HY814_01035, partial [Candidatus Riflebacteria bacterium]|nr:hypothetical protein [Candidatus Riflebacteria bacterium]